MLNKIVSRERSPHSFVCKYGAVRLTARIRDATEYTRPREFRPRHSVVNYPRNLADTNLKAESRDCCRALQSRGDGVEYTVPRFQAT